MRAQCNQIQYNINCLIPLRQETLRVTCNDNEG